jgi:hypothetical protein
MSTTYASLNRLNNPWRPGEFHAPTGPQEQAGTVLKPSVGLLHRPCEPACACQGGPAPFALISTGRLRRRACLRRQPGRIRDCRMKPSLHLKAPGNLAGILLCSSWLILPDPGVAAGQEPACPGIHITVLGIRNTVGAIDCALFDGPKGFPTERNVTAFRTTPKARSPPRPSGPRASSMTEGCSK